MRILVVEDDKNLNRQLVDALQENGYVVDKAFDGEEGHFLGETEPYDGVILDLGLPVLDGVSVLEKWRAGANYDSLAAKYHDAHTYAVDGFSAEYADWHFNVRASNTEPLLRLNLEAKTQAMMEQKRDEVLAVIRQA
mgnify:CR=1 FL=1